MKNRCIKQKFCLLCYSFMGDYLKIIFSIIVCPSNGITREKSKAGKTNKTFVYSFYINLSMKSLVLWENSHFFKNF